MVMCEDDRSTRRAPRGDTSDGVGGNVWAKHTAVTVACDFSRLVLHPRRGGRCAGLVARDHTGSGIGGVGCVDVGVRLVPQVEQERPEGVSLCGEGGHLLIGGMMPV